MSSSIKNLSTIEVSEVAQLKNVKIGIVTSEWNHEITFALLDGCTATLKKYGCSDNDILSIQVPGAFELPSGAKLLLSNNKLDAVICLGCVIKGETKHDEYICNAVSVGIMSLSVASGKPVIFGLLTPNDIQQAIDRSGGKYGNKGVEAALTAIKMIHLSNEVKNMEKNKIGF